MSTETVLQPAVDDLSRTILTSAPPAVSLTSDLWAACPSFALPGEEEVLEEHGYTRKKAGATTGYGQQRFSWGPHQLVNQDPWSPPLVSLSLSTFCWCPQRSGGSGQR